MTLQIDKPGKLPKHHDRWAGKCTVCKCEVSTTDKADLREGYSGTDAQHGYYVMCPTMGCNRQIDMKKVVLRGS